MSDSIPGRRVSDTMAGGMPESDVSSVVLRAMYSMQEDFRQMTQQVGHMTEKVGQMTARVENIMQDQHDTKNHGDRINTLEADLKNLKEQLKTTEEREENWKNRNSKNIIGIIALVLTLFMIILGIWTIYVMMTRH